MSNYAQKLASMRSRRLGLDGGMALDKAVQFSEAVALKEAYESRTAAQATKYALGAMQALDAKYTRISIQEGDRVRNQLQDGLQQAGIPVAFEYQGSVPLDIHIRFASDIDLLVLQGQYFTFDPTGPRGHAYVPWSGSMLDELMKLRRTCEQVLEQRFPAVSVDKSGGKSIALSGGSLQRKVDVVPSHWHDTAAYQASGAKHDREVMVLSRDERITVNNRPFLHMMRIDEKDRLTNGGAKKVIRLLKNIKKDAAKSIALTSYDIAALVWHFDSGSINKPYYLELSLVAEAQNHLQLLIANPTRAMSLDVPDRSRKVFDSTDKFVALYALKAEVDELAMDIAREIAPAIYGYGHGSEAVRRALLDAQVF